MKRTPEQGALMHQLLRELPLLENLAMRAGLPITCRAIQNAVRASGWEAAGDTERANYYAPNTEGFAAGVKGPLPVECEAGHAPQGKCEFGPYGWRGVIVCKHCKQAPPAGVRACDGSQP